MSHEITKVTERLVYENGFVRLYDDDVRFPNGAPGRYLRLEAALPGNAVVLLPMHGTKIGLVRTFRYALGKLVWELPRGLSHGTDLGETAENELREELGIDVADFKILGFITPDSGLQSARVAVMSARVADMGRGPDDSVEVERVQWVETAQLEDMIRSGEVEDSFTIAAYALSRLLESPRTHENSMPPEPESQQPHTSLH
ncbi:NUDIX hydrolase [Arthrobacter sp. LjRoot78]|uniref:NUDIX hydrolase n=1 Tax=Arthrobacter sp. LjRoot78 TaxID=3342338 RepID=UPI003ECF0CA3